MDAETSAIVLMQQGVTPEHLDHYIRDHGFPFPSFIHNVLHYMIVHTYHYVDTNPLVESLLTPNDHITPPSAPHTTHHSSTSTPTSSGAEPMDELFEPWSPTFQASALKQEEIVSSTLACLQDGEYK